MNLDLGKWIKEKYGSQEGLAAELGVQQSRVSKWLKGREPIPETYREAIKALKFKGGWPSRDVGADATTAPAGDYITREEFAEWRVSGWPGSSAENP